MEEKVIRMKELINILNEASYEYYKNSNPIMSDYEYDKLYDELFLLESDLNMTLSNSPTVNVEPEVQTEVLDLPESQEVLKAFVEQGEGWEWTEHNLHEKLEVFRGEFKEKGIKPKATMWAIRGAVTGRTRGADMTATLEILGKENCLARAKKAIK